jgi:DNA-binding MarR family transcriptional regulator
MGREPTTARARPGVEVDDDQALDGLEAALAVLARRLEQASRTSELHRRLDRAGYLLARTLDLVGPIGVNELALHLGLDGSTVTRQATALVDRGFVSRRPDPTDGRAVLLSLTAAGRREVERVRAARLARLRETVADWEPVDVSTLATLLDRLNRSLDATSPRPPSGPRRG